MLQKFKEFISARNEQFHALATSVAAASAPVPVVSKSAEMIIIDNFEKYIQSLNDNSNVPKKAIQHLNEILILTRDINFDDMSIDNQSLIRRILEVDTKTLMDVYLSLPKAHAVSVVLENGQTAKQTVIENVHNLYNKINEIFVDAINKKTELLLKKQKVAQLKEKRKDFFDL